MDTKKKLIPKRKGYDPILTPGPNVLCTNQPKRYYRGREPIKPRIFCLKRLCPECEVPHSTAVRSFSFHDEGREIASHQVRKIVKYLSTVLVESLFQNYWFCLIKCTQASKIILKCTQASKIRHLKSHRHLKAFSVRPRGTCESSRKSARR